MTDTPSPDPQPEAPAADAKLDADAQQHIVAVVFDKATRADEALLAMIHVQQEGGVAMSDAVVVAKRADGHTSVRQTVDITPGRAGLSAARGSAPWSGCSSGDRSAAHAGRGAGGGALRAAGRRRPRRRLGQEMSVARPGHLGTAAPLPRPRRATRRCASWRASKAGSCRDHVPRRGTSIDRPGARAEALIAAPSSDDH